MHQLHSVALFRLSVLGPLASRQSLSRGELKSQLQALSKKHYDIPGTRNTLISPKTIESWYYAWKKGGVEALNPQPRVDRGISKIPEALQNALIKAKQDNPKRSLNSLMKLMRLEKFEGADQLSRSSVYRLLVINDLSRPVGATQVKELRRFEADYPGDLIYGDVMHGPKVVVDGKTQKGYLVSLMDDKSRLILHSAFCTGETALDIEGVLKTALLRRGLPKRLVIDNGAAYRSHSLQGICARLSIQLIYCKPYAPEGKGKLERWHRTLRDQFLTELTAQKIYALDELNALLEAWIDQMYHSAPHAGLNGKSPITVWRDYIHLITPLGQFAHKLDEIFYHRIQRKVRKDGTISYHSQLFEVPYTLAQKTVMIVVEPHHGMALFVEDDQGRRIGEITPLDLKANRNYKRANSTVNEPKSLGANDSSIAELALEQQHAQLCLPDPCSEQACIDHSDTGNL